MLPKKPKHLLYGVLLIALSIIGTSAIAKTKVHHLIADITSTAMNSESSRTLALEEKNKSKSSSFNNKQNTVSSMPMFVTIIMNADEEVTCLNDGSTVARFNLCGDFDNRIIAVQGTHSNYTWQRLTGGTNCDIDSDCPQIADGGGTCGGNWVNVSTNPTFTPDPTSILSSSGAEYRVSVSPGGGSPFYYFKVKKSTITQTYVKRDFICGVDGRIQITNLSSAYEYSIDNGSGFGAWQPSAIFNGLTSGTYIVKARLQGTLNTCEYPYDPIIIEQQDIDIDVTFIDAQCFGENGSITVDVNNVPGPYKYTLLDDSGVPQEFTTFIPDNPYTFAAVGFGTYSVQVETQQCTGDPANGISAPRQDFDTGGNPIVIGDGLVALSASTEVNDSFGCNVTDVDIIVRTSGGAPPYTFTVSDGGSSATSYMTETTYTVTSPGSYDFVITDANGCPINASADVEELTPPDITAGGTDGTCSNGGAKIDFNIIDAKGYNLSFRATPSDPWTTNPQVSVSAGTYTNIQVRYQQGSFDCILDLTDVVTVNTVNVINGSAVKNADITCNISGSTDGGIIEFQGPFSGGSGSGYVFSISGDAPANFSTQTLYTNLSPGTYTPIIRDDGGCRLELTPITILDIDPPTAIAFAQSNINCGAGTSDVQLTVTSNAAIARYEVISPLPIIDNGASDTFTGLSTTTAYLFRVTDINGCTYTDSFTPANISSIRARVKSGGDTRVCFGELDGTGTFIIDGFANNYTYNIDGGPESAPQNADEVDLPLSGDGTYIITVRDQDTGCTDTASITIEESPALSIAGSTVTPMSCSNNNLGSVRVNPVGGWGGNRYTLLYPDGITVVGPQSGRTFGNLLQESTPGNPYTLTVEDAEGCTDTFTFDLTEVDAPTIALDSGASDFCYVPGTGATIVVSSTAGTAAIGTHQYRINGGTLQPTNTFSDLSPGNYTIEVIDGNNCRHSITETIRPQLRVRTSITTEIPCGGLPGRIRVRATGGYLTGGVGAIKQYEVSSDNGVSYAAPVALTSNTFNYDTATPGDYVFRVTDNEGCVSTSTPITLAPPLAILANTVVIPASCGEANNGVIQINPVATSGIPPFEIDFGNTGTYTPQTVYSNLNSGQTYFFTVRDARGCETVGLSETIPLSGVAPPDANISPIDATCSGGVILSGGVQINSVTDGTPNFTYIVQDQFGAEIVRVGPTANTSETIADPLLVTGDYTLVTLDSFGCRDEDPFTIISNEVVINPINFTPALTCDDTGFTYTVEVTPTISPIVPTYQIRIAGQSAFYALNDSAGPDTHEFSNATDGIQYGVAYTVEVLAPNGCIYEQEIPPIDGFSNIVVTALSDTVFCDDNNNGLLTYSVANVTGPNLGVIITNLDTNTEIFNGVINAPYNGSLPVPVGNYRVVVTDSDGCTDGDAALINLNAPRVDVLSNIPANCNALGQLTIRGSGGSPFAVGSPYLYAVVTSGTPVDEDGTATPADPLDDFTSETTWVLPGSLAGITYDIWVLDDKGCTFRVSEDVIQLQPDLVDPTFFVNNQCDVTTTTFQIEATMPPGTQDPTFTLGGDSQTFIVNPLNPTAPITVTFTVNTPGQYTVDVIDINGCTSSADAEVFEFLVASGDFTTIPTCNVDDGVITIETNGGSGDFNFDLTGLDYLGNSVAISQVNDPIFNGMAPGNYQVLVTDNLVSDITGNCMFLVDDINLIGATPPIIDTDISEDISCNGANNGSITVTLLVGTDVDTPIEFILNNTDTSSEVTRNNTGVFPNLPSANYQVEVLSARNCSALSAIHFIDEPLPFAISASAPPFSCESGANRFSSTIITVTVPPATAGTIGSGYQYSITGFENYQTNNTFEIIDDGSTQNITVYAIDGSGCQTTSISVDIPPPTGVVPVFSVQSVLNCRDVEVVRVQIPASQTTDFTVTTVSVSPVADVTNIPGEDYVDIALPTAGDYIFQVRDNIAGCLYPIPRHEVISPINPIVTISEAKPITCFGVDDGELFIDVTNYVGLYDYEVFAIDNLGNETTISITGSFDTTNFPDIITGDLARISGLPGGNFIVKVNSTDNPFCTGDSNLATIRTPNGLLDVSAVEVGNVSCDDNIGKIEANGAGGWDTLPYEYRLLQEDTTGVIVIGGTNYTERYVFDVANEFENLSSGNYRIEIRDVEGCEDFFNITLDAITPISAGIREPSGLVCPAGNNAILEAYDPTTGDAITATAGATGGVADAGYNYQLIYLGSNDITDELSRSGLQNTPTFTGTTGGFISAGWYAIEVSSSFNCEGITIPYYVDPPPAIIPNLVQVRAPGCGGLGEMRLSIENPEVGFMYEYRPTGALSTDPFTPMGIAASVLIPGNPGFYQYDVRKVSATNICDVVVSNGLTLIDAQMVDLQVNLPDDISCAFQLDGRIESFASGGVGDYWFTLYDGDPGSDPFNPSASATIVQGPINDGTFEGLGEGTGYYVTVTSGAVCGDVEGPYVIVEPAPILFRATPNPISCNGEVDGSIVIEVLSGGEGLIQFAISPNFTDFFNNPDTPGQYVFTDLDNGTYEILIQDSTGCPIRDTIDVSEPEELEVTASATPELCLDASDGTITAIITGGTPFTDPITSVRYYETRISGPGFLEPDPSDPTEGFVRNDDLFFDNLQGNETYVIFVRDVNDCSDDYIVPIGMGVDIAAEAIPEYGCDGIFPNNTVTVNMQDTSLLPSLMFYLEDINALDPTIMDYDDRLALADTQYTWGDLPPSDYIVYIFHENGCIGMVDFSIIPYEPLVLDVEKTGPNELTATASGGYGGYEYFFQGNSTGSENVFTLNTDAVVTIRVEDIRGCFLTASIPFDFTGMLELPNFFTPNGDVLNDVWSPKNTDFFPNLEVKIYDRYGRVVAILDKVLGWDGTYEGNELPTGDYWYVVNQNDDRSTQYVGHFTLYR